MHRSARALRRFTVGLGVALLAACPLPAGGLRPPSDAPPFPSALGGAFDNGLTLTKIALEGRAPHDVVDQRLFGQRLGHADIVALSKVQQVWSRGRNEGAKEQFVQIEIGDVLLGELPKGAEAEQVLQVSVHDPLSGSLAGQEMLLFVHWDPGAAPPYRHHLMPAERDTVAFVQAMIEHAKDAGVLTDRGVPAKGVTKAPPE